MDTATLVQAIVDARANLVAARRQHEDAQVQYVNAQAAVESAEKALNAGIEEAAAKSPVEVGKLTLEVAAPIENIEKGGG